MPKSDFFLRATCTCCEIILYINIIVVPKAVLNRDIFSYLLWTKLLSWLLVIIVPLLYIERVDATFHFDRFVRRPNRPIVLSLFANKMNRKQ